MFNNIYCYIYIQQSINYNYKVLHNVELRTHKAKTLGNTSIKLRNNLMLNREFKFAQKFLL